MAKGQRWQATLNTETPKRRRFKKEQTQGKSRFERKLSARVGESMVITQG